jgi:hypothetical protein
LEVKRIDLRNLTKRMSELEAFFDGIDTFLDLDRECKAEYWNNFIDHNEY